MVKKLVENLLHKDLSYVMRGAAIEVRKDSGSGHKEKLYQVKLFESILASIGLILVFFGGINAAHAEAIGRLYFSAPQVVPLGAEFPVKVLVDSDQPLNAYTINFTYPSQYLEILNFNNSRSIIDVWQNQPVVSAGGTVSVRGGSLKPFSGGGGEILTVNFKALQSASATLDFEKSSALYLANGKGTKVTPQTESFSIAVQSSTSASVFAQAQQAAQTDNSPPEIKFLSIIPDPFNKNQKLLGFLVSDAGSGIKETSLRARSFLRWGDWMPASNPTALPLSVWSVDFRVVDQSGNITEKTIYDWPAFRRLVLVVLAAAAGIVAILILLIKKGRKQNEKIENSN
jgi:hypothetical protein